MPSHTELGLERRRFLVKVAGVLGLTAGCGTTASLETTVSPLTTRSIAKDASPTTAPKKEAPAQRTPWTEGIVLPTHPSDLRLTREAFFTADNMVFFTNPQGYSTAYNIEKGKVWRWEEDQALVYGADTNIVYAFRQDRRLFAIDAKNGQKKWSLVFPTMSNANIEWPFLICKTTVHPGFRPSQQQFPFASVSKENGEILWISNGNTKAIGSTQNSVIAESWVGWGKIFKIDAITGRQQELVNFGDVYFGNHNRRIVDGQLIFIRYRPTSGRPPIGAVGSVDIDSGRVIWQSADLDEPAILFVSPTRIYIRWSATFTQQGLLAIDRQTGSTVMQEKDFSKEDFIGEKDDWFVWSQSKLGQTTFINVVNGATSTNDDLRLTGVAGTTKNIMVGFYADPSRRQSFLYGVDITSKNADRKWRVQVEQTTPPPIIVGDKVVYSSGQALQVLDAQTGNRLTSIAVPGATHFTKHKDTLLVQAGNPGQVGRLSAVSV